MEKKIKKTPGEKKSVSDKSEEQTIVVIIILALVVLGALLVNLIVFTPIATEPFSAIYYLDSEKQTTNLPRTVILGENNTLSLWVGVENQNKSTIDYEVKIKIDDRNGQLNYSFAETVESFALTLEDGEIKEFPVNINVNKLGPNRIIFELWFFNGRPESYYSGKWVDLSVEAI
jgi:uncharacterized membrane protein